MFLRNILVLAGAVLTVGAHAQVFSVNFFLTPPIFVSSFDDMTPGQYSSFQAFGGFGVASPIGDGLIKVGGSSIFASSPNAVVGNGGDIRIRSITPMRWFGGVFRNVSLPQGTATMATFKFYTQRNVLIGAVQAPLSSAWNWIGFATSPSWSRIDIIGNIKNTPGGVVMDNLRVMP